jgi:hypothetical protein
MEPPAEDQFKRVIFKDVRKLESIYSQEQYEYPDYNNQYYNQNYYHPRAYQQHNYGYSQGYQEYYPNQGGHYGY